MEDLLQSQIKESCDLALPNGLKELMWDISREVLRAKPQDVYDFVTKYLSVLLVTRENLSVAAKVCDETCYEPCQTALEDKLKEIGLNDEDINAAITIITKHFQGEVNEGNILMKLIKKTNIHENSLPALQEAIRSAFIHHVHETRIFESSIDFEVEVKEAVSHTLRLYERTNTSNEQYNQMAEKIQAAYRAYGVRRAMCAENKEKPSEIKFDQVHVEIKEPEMTKTPRSNNRASVTTESSTSLAGSYLKLPICKPYSVHDIHLYDYEEVIEIKHSNTDFMKDVNNRSKNLTCYDHKDNDGKKRISFEALTIEDYVLEADDESEGTVEEMIHVEEDVGDVESKTSEIHDVGETSESEDGDKIKNYGFDDLATIAAMSESSNSIMDMTLD